MGRPFIFEDENKNNTSGVNTTGLRNKPKRQIVRSCTPLSLLQIQNCSEEQHVRENQQHEAETLNVLMHHRQDQQQVSSSNVMHEFTTIPLTPALTRAFRTSEARMQRRLESLTFNLSGEVERRRTDNIEQRQHRLPMRPNAPQHNQDTTGCEQSPFIVSGR